MGLQIDKEMIITGAFCIDSDWSKEDLLKVMDQLREGPLDAFLCLGNRIIAGGLIEINKDLADGFVEPETDKHYKDNPCGFSITRQPPENIDLPKNNISDKYITWIPGDRITF